MKNAGVFAASAVAVRPRATARDADANGTFDDRAWMLETGDRYMVSGCDEAHDVVAVSRPRYDSHIDLVVYLPGEDRVTDVRVHRDRLLNIQRPLADDSVTTPPAPQPEV
ncbi:hypothetical protein [Streptomyces virginiae]|uniref:hypothetical protein n=1 Tax=Streptomyces virginiae TaxID=1961 RepID=UPI0036AFAFFF